MQQKFQIKAIESQDVDYLFDLSDKELSKICATLLIVDEKPGFPCRVSLQDANIGEEVVLFTYKHHDTESPYQSYGPVFVRKNAQTEKLKVNEIPKMLNHRLLSIRAYDKDTMMVDARTIKGIFLKKTIQNVFDNRKVAYLHIHNSGPGCYNCKVERVN